MYTGITLANLRLVETTPTSKEALNKVTKGFEITCLRILSTEIGTLKGPTAFPVLSWDISVSISLVVAGNIKKLFGNGDFRFSNGEFGTFGIKLARLFPMFVK